MTTAGEVLLFAAVAAAGGAALLMRDVRAGAVAFIAFGLLLTLAWASVAAPDVALAEAAIGAGVTGALLLDAGAELRGAQAAEAPRTPGSGRAPFAALVIALCAALGAFLTLGAAALPESPGVAMRLVGERIGETGVSHPVTGVLLAFRAYDTLIEVGVLLAAAIVARGLAGSAPDASAAPAPDAVLERVAALSIPTAVLVALYLLWAGATRTGGAFQAGAVLAGAMLLGRFVGVPAARLPDTGERLALGGGFAFFIAVGVIAGLAAGAVLAYPAGWGGALILAIEATLTVSIAAGLVALFGPGDSR